MYPSMVIAKEAGFVHAGDRLLTETHRPVGEGLLGFACRRDRGLRRLIRAAGYPSEVTVLSVSRVPDEPSDVALLLDFGVGTYTLHLHSEFLIRSRTSDV